MSSLLHIITMRFIDGLFVSKSTMTDIIKSLGQLPEEKREKAVEETLDI